MLRLSPSAPLPGGPKWPNIRLRPERLLSILTIILIILPSARAGSGEDFSNNLFSDLAPILALFGEQVAKQFLSHSTSWLDCLIFACNPISIITGVTSAIRVAGSRWLKSIIGRAGEAEATAELELMSSTSSDVCELWNGVGVVRVVGSPAITELIYCTKCNDTRDSTSPAHCDPSYSDSAEVYTLEKAKTAGLFTLKSRTRHTTSLPEVNERFLEQTEDQMRSPPNIFRNTSPEPGNSIELMIIAFIGVILQAGVLIYDALITYHPRWKKDRDGLAVANYAFPLTFFGTLAIVLGMFICAFVIEARTDEERWQAAGIGKNESFQIIWLQRGELVGDQAFGSYAIYAPQNQRVIITSRKSWNGLGKLQFWSLWGSVAAIVGFICQFVGLRNMHWTATIAQLIATVIMTVLRVVIRRHLSKLPIVRQLPEGFELDLMAKSITECEDWHVLTTAVPNLLGDQDPIPEVSAFATRVLRTRMRLSELMGWRTECSDIADQVMETILAVMNHLYDSEAEGGVSIAKAALKVSEFIWTVPITISRTSGLETGKLSLKLHRTSTEGRWTPWEANRGEFEALISLWISSHFRQLSFASNLWILGPHNIFIAAAYDWWVYRGTNSTCIQNLHDVCETNQVSEHRILNLSSIPLPASDINTSRTYPSGEELLGVVTKTTLQQMCSQYLLGSFLGRVTEIIDNLGGKTDVIPGVGGSSYTLVNENIRKISEMIQRHGVVTVEDSYRLVVSPLSQFNKLCDPLDDQDVLRKIAIVHKDCEDKTPDYSAPNHSNPNRLIHYCTAKAALLGEKDQWMAARKAFVQLIDVSQEILGASHFCTIEATKSMKDFAAAFVDIKIDDANCRSPKFTENPDEAFPLHSAVSRGQLKRVLDLLNAGTGVDTANAESQTPLSLALKSNQPDVARLLIFYGAEISHATSIEQIRKEGDPQKAEVVRILILNWGSMTLLHEAAAKGVDMIVETLLEKGMDISAKDKRGWGALQNASKFGHTTTVKLLIDNGADLNERCPGGRTALHIATMGGHGAIVRLLVENGASLNTHDDQGQTALHLAALGGLDMMVKELLDSGADIDSEDNNKHTALHLAIENAHEVVAEQLVLHGASLSARDKSGFTPLHFACKGTVKDTRIIEIMVERGADLAATDIWGVTPLGLAAQEGKELAVRLLIAKGADTTIRNDAGRGPLILAVMKGHIGVTKFLIEKGFNMTCKDGFRRTPLHYAALGGYETIVDLLLRKGVDINAPDIDGWTPLHYAYRNHYQRIIKILLDGGADPSIKDRKGRVASDYSAQQGKSVTWLRALGVD